MKQPLKNLITLRQPIMAPDGLEYQYILSEHFYNELSEHTQEVIWGVKYKGAIILELNPENFSASFKVVEVPYSGPVDVIFDVDKYIKKNKESFEVKWE